MATGGASPLMAQALGTGFLGSEIPFQADRQNNVGVLDRPHPEYDPIPIRINSFRLAPALGLGGGYDSNVYGQTNNGKSDEFATIEPNVSLNSDWSRHALQLSGGATLRRYAHETARNESGLNAQALGRLDLQDLTLIGVAAMVQGYEEQYSGDQPANVAIAIRYRVKSGLARAIYSTGRVRLTASGDISRITLKDSVAFDGTIVDQSYRNRTVSRGSGRIEFGATPSSALFAQVSYSRSDYGAPVAPLFIDRDSNEIRVLGGATTDLTHLIRAIVGVGFVDRRYASPAFQNIRGLAADVRLEYFMSQLSTVTFQLQRKIEDSSQLTIGGYFVTSANLAIDHELLRNLLLNANVGYQRQVYKGVPGSGSVYQLQTGANYKMNRNLGFKLGASYLKRTTQGTPLGKQYDEFRGTLSLQYRL